MAKKLELLSGKLRNKSAISIEEKLAAEREARLKAELLLAKRTQEFNEASKHLKETNGRLTALLEEEGKSLDSVFINLPDPYLIIDLSSKILSMNNSASAFLGYDCKDEDVQLYDLVHNDYTEYTEKSFKALLKQGVLKNYKAKWIAKNGEEKYVSVNANVIYNKKGSPIAIQGIVRDITTDTQVKHMVETQKKQLDLIVENSSLGILLIKNGKIAMANHAFCKMLDYTNDELAQLTLEDISTIEDTSYYEQILDNGAISDNESLTLVRVFQRKNGELLYGKTALKNVNGENEGDQQQVVMVEDITEQKKLHSQKENLVEALEESNRSLEEYAHIVSHDLKSPLRSVSALVDWLCLDYKNKLDERGLYSLQMIQDKIEAMDRLISDILRYSTLSSSNLKSVDVDINEIIRNIQDIIFVPNNVKIQIVGRLPVIKADKTMMHQLFQNFLSNAVEHIDKPKGLVTIESKDIKTHWQFSISDNGMGIAKEYHKKIFQIFQSIGNKEGSTGIGLSIIKKIIERYKGQVWLESEIGQGTTFYFTLKKEIE